MAKPKLKRQGILGQFVLGSDMYGAPITTTVTPSPAYTRTHMVSGLVIGGRSARNFYHPTVRHGVIYQAPGITIYKWVRFGAFSLNEWATLANGLTVDGVITPSAPVSMSPMHFTISGTAWHVLGVPAGATIRSVHVIAEVGMIAPLPQFVGFDTGTGDSRGNLLNLLIGINGTLITTQVSLGPVGFDVPLGFYNTGITPLEGIIDYTFVLAPPTFDIDIELIWQFVDARFTLQSLQFNILHS